MTSNIVILNDGTDFGTKAGKLAAVMQGEVGPAYLIDVQDLAGNDFDITNATGLEGRLENPKTGVVIEITGALAPSGGGISWTRAAEDIGTAGNFSAVFEFVLSAKQYKTFPASIAVIADPAANDVGGVTLVKISEALKEWLEDEKTGIEAADDGEILQSDGTNSEGTNYLTATSLRKHNFTAVTAPGVGDDTGDGYAAGSYWVDTVGGAVYFCQDATLGAAVWIDVSAAGGLANIVEDTTPQLGGNLDLNGNVITGLEIGTDVQAYDADTAKLDAAQSWTAAQNLQDNELIRPKLRDYGETVNAIGSIGGGTQDINLELGNVVSGTVDTSTTTFTFSNPSASGTACSFSLRLTNGGSQTVNWPASVQWAGGAAPTLTAAGVDWLTFVTLDGGTTWDGFPAGLDMS